MDEDFRWAIIGPGRIAHQFAEAVSRSPGMRIAALQGRDAEHARIFAERWRGADQPAIACHADIPHLVQSGEIDAVYIATPHSHHADAVKRCLNAHIPVLCEKPLVPNHALAEQLVTLARKQQTFLMEAMWTRFLPIYQDVRTWLTEERIGPVSSIHSSFSFDAPYDSTSRVYDPALAGGAMLDIGVYSLSMSRWVAECVTEARPQVLEVRASGIQAPTGVDRRAEVEVQFASANGPLQAFLVCDVGMQADSFFHIRGERGEIEMSERFWQATQATLHVDGEESVEVKRSFAVNGFEYELQEVVRCVRAGEIESAVMPHDESLAALATIDEIRRQIGVRYPFE